MLCGRRLGAADGLEGGVADLRGAVAEEALEQVAGGGAADVALTKMPPTGLFLDAGERFDGFLTQ